jgi:hypothetical protein
MKYLASFVLVLLTYSSVLAGGLPNESEFQASLTRALKAQDREAFYKLVCFDGVDKNWEKANKEIIEDLFTQAANSPGFTGSIGSSGANIPQPMSTQRYNLPLIAAYLIHIAPGTTMNIPLGLKDGQLKVVCLVSKPVETTQ